MLNMEIIILYKTSQVSQPESINVFKGNMYLLTLFQSKKSL